jgi:hypothetical protein
MTTIGLAGLLGLTACSAGVHPDRSDVASAGSAAASPGSDVASAGSDAGDEALALTEVGFETGLETVPAPAASGAATDAGRKIGPARRLLRRNTLHGEVTLQTKKGVRTVIVQRGTATAVTATTVTVTSTDGFTTTWTFADKMRIRKDKKKADRAAVKGGAEVGVAGAQVGNTTTARLIVVA